MWNRLAKNHSHERGGRRLECIKFPPCTQNGSLRGEQVEDELAAPGAQMLQRVEEMLWVF